MRPMYRQAEDVLKASKNYIEKVAPAAFYHMMAALRYLDPASSDGCCGARFKRQQTLLRSNLSSRLIFPPIS